jgi:hypothetical protein
MHDWCRYTFNDDASLANSTIVNLKERDAFVIAPVSWDLESQSQCLTYGSASPY